MKRQFKNRSPKDATEIQIPPGPSGRRESASVHFKKCMAAYMLDTGATVAEAVRVTGLDKKTVGRVKRGEYNLSPEVMEAVREIESAKMTEKFNLLLDSIDADKIEKATLSQVAVAAGIMYDKRALAENRPTSIVETSYSDDVLNEKHAEVLKELQWVKEQLGDVELEADYEEVEAVEWEKD